VPKGKVGAAIGLELLAAKEQGMLWPRVQRRRVSFGLVSASMSPGDQLEREPSAFVAVRHPVRKRGSRAMARFSELLQELARAERDVAEGQARLARQAQLVRDLDADGHDTTFSARRLLVMMTNLNQMESRRQRLVRELSVSQRELAA
jgi:hypothetical protein